MTYFAISKGHYVFQHENGSIHTAKATRKWQTDQNIKRMDWPSLSSDLNPIERLWSVLSQKVYANGRQFKHEDSSLKHLKVARQILKKNP